MPPLDNPKEEALAQAYVTDPETRFNQTQSYLKVIPTVTQGTAEVMGARVFGKDSVKTRIHEILEGQLGLTDDFLLKFGREKFLECEDKNVGMKAWRTFLEIKGIINQDACVSIATVTFNDTIVTGQAQDVVCRSDGDNDSDKLIGYDKA